MSVAALVAITGCSSGSDDDSARTGSRGSEGRADRGATDSSTTDPTTTDAPTQGRTALEEVCGDASPGGEAGWIDVEGVGRIQVGTIGTGEKVAVFFHQGGRGSMCGFAEYASWLAEQGVRSVLVNQCGHGDSECDAGLPVVETWPAVARAVIADAKGDGATRITVVGASAGGALAMVMAAESPDIHAMVTLSGALDYSGLDSTAAAAEVRQPVLIAVAPEDEPTPEDLQALGDAISSTEKQVVVVDDQVGDHGWDLLMEGEEWTPLAEQARTLIVG